MITTVVNYCTNEFRHLSLLLEQARLFSSSIVVVCADHFFDGSPEDRRLLNHTYLAHPDVQFVEYAFDLTKCYGLYPRKREEDMQGAQYWHSTSRYIGYHYLPSQCEYVLFLDADEIPDGMAVKRWLAQGEYRHFDGIRFTCYLYHTSASQRATKEARCGLLLRCESVQPETLLDVHERRGTFLSLQGERLEDVRGSEGEPLFHHYSWVRTPSEKERKKETWGHRHEVKKIEDDLATLQFSQVTPFCDPLAVTIPTDEPNGEPCNVAYTTPGEVFRRSLYSYNLNIFS